ncbi:MAG: glycosyltransferase family 39 protein [Acidobacteriia bacterium]|nr:glycosyltransferase family 39 protein [Terriglobia bacterium]
MPKSAEIESRTLHPSLIFALAFLAVFALHIPLLRLPYFWDEAGYYVPAARDLLLSGSVIPHSTPSNAHPPLVMAYLAFCWRMAGYTPLVTRTAMLLISAFSLAGVFRLAQRVANVEVAVASTICTALYPVFFAQSSLAHLDLAAAGLTFWALGSYVEQRRGQTVLWFSLAVLAKETAVLAPLALFAWELVCPMLHRERRNPSLCLFPRRSWKSTLLLVPLLPLGFWYGYHYLRTGVVFGNPEFFRYNVLETLYPLRVLLALLLRLWQALGYQNLYLLMLATGFAMWRPPIHDASGQRRRIAPGVQFAFLTVIVSYVIFMALVGGAVLARYMLPVVPLVIITGVSTLRRRVQVWRGVVAIVGLAFVVGLFVNPPYGFSPEDNLAYRDYILLHQHAEEFVEARYPMARVLTAWPASDELTRPYLGYVTRPMRVVRIEDFTVEQLMSTADIRSRFDVALVFSTKYEPPHPLFDDWPTWIEWKTRFFGWHRDVPPSAAAQLLGGQLVYTERRRGQWVGVVELERVVEARRSIPH